MTYHSVLAVLVELRELTRRGVLAWVKDDDQEWFSSKLHGRTIMLRRMLFEAENQVGADYYGFDLHMPGLNSYFPFGTEGAQILFEVLRLAFDERWGPDGKGALDFLRGEDEHI